MKPHYCPTCHALDSMVGDRDLLMVCKVCGQSVLDDPDPATHLHYLSDQFTGSAPYRVPDADLCRAEKHPEAWQRLMHVHLVCVHAADVHHNRRRFDQEGGIALAAAADAAHDASIAAIERVWKGAVSEYDYVLQGFDLVGMPWEE